MTTKYHADDAPAIKRRMEEIQAERMRAIMGKPIEETKEVPTAGGWAMYGTGSGNLGHDYDPA